MVLIRTSKSTWWLDNNIISSIVGHMGGTSQDVKRLKKSGIFTVCTLGFLDHLHFFALIKITMCFKHLEASHIMSCDS